MIQINTAKILLFSLFCKIDTKLCIRLGILLTGDFRRFSGERGKYEGGIKLRSAYNADRYNDEKVGRADVRIQFGRN